MLMKNFIIGGGKYYKNKHNQFGNGADTDKEQLKIKRFYPNNKRNTKKNPKLHYF